MTTSSIAARAGSATSPVSCTGVVGVDDSSIDCVSSAVTDIGFAAYDARTRATAAANLAHLFRKLARLYTGGEASSLSQLEAARLARSLEFVLGLRGEHAEQATYALATCDPSELFSSKQRELARRVDAALEVWGQIVTLMPPIRNIALRDTLASIGRLKTSYDTYFAAHEVPCDIDYQLHRPIDPALEGIDYIDVYLDQLASETRWIARFAPDSCIAVLERVCPDYRGLHVNLVDLLEPHEEELQRR